MLVRTTEFWHFWHVPALPSPLLAISDGHCSSNCFIRAWWVKKLNLRRWINVHRRWFNVHRRWFNVHRRWFIFCSVLLHRKNRPNLQFERFFPFFCPKGSVPPCHAGMCGHRAGTVPTPSLACTLLGICVAHYCYADNQGNYIYAKSVVQTNIALL